jgi:hypothetical protein
VIFNKSSFREFSVSATPWPAHASGIAMLLISFCGCVRKCTLVSLFGSMGERTATSGQLDSYFSTVASCPDHKRTYHQHCSANKDELQQYAFASAQGRRAVRQIHYHAQDAHTMRTPRMLEP